MSWKNWPSWLKGGVLAGLLIGIYYIIALLILFSHFGGLEEATFSTYFYIYYLPFAFVVGFIFGFILGAIIGPIIEYLKKSKCSYLKRGVLISIIITILILVHFIIVLFLSSDYFRGSWYIHSIMGFMIITPLIFFLFLIPASILGVVIGALTGFIYGKFKSKSKKNESSN